MLRRSMAFRPTAGMGHSRRFRRVSATSGYPPKLTVKADVGDPLLALARFEILVIKKTSAFQLELLTASRAAPKTKSPAQSRAEIALHGRRNCPANCRAIRCRFRG